MSVDAFEDVFHEDAIRFLLFAFRPITYHSSIIIHQSSPMTHETGKPVQSNN
jgi:hypothetical protein